jgi:DNA-binding transcriptional ArsR family regulator
MQTTARRASPRAATHAPAARRPPDELGPVFAAIARYFALLADSTRLSILHAICETEHSVGEIVAVTGASQTNVSRHLGRLHAAGVISRKRVGNRVHYLVADPALTAICRTVCAQIAARIDAGEPLRRNLVGFAQGHPAAKPAATVASRRRPVAGAAGRAR